MQTDKKAENMSIFEIVGHMVSKALKEDEDRKIDYLLTGKIPEEFKCECCRERLKRLDTER